jgi:hypothetical protein
MNEKIILADLDKLLFPHLYPYFKSHFEEESALLKEKTLSDTAFLNIKFKVKLVRYSLNIKDTDCKELINFVFEKHIDKFYDWRREYDWYELKSVLFFFIFFRNVSSSKELFKKLENRKTLFLFEKYVPNPNVEMVIKP